MYSSNYHENWGLSWCCFLDKGKDWDTVRCKLESWVNEQIVIQSWQSPCIKHYCRTVITWKLQLLDRLIYNNVTYLSFKSSWCSWIAGVIDNVISIPCDFSLVKMSAVRKGLIHTTEKWIGLKEMKNGSWNRCLWGLLATIACNKYSAKNGPSMFYFCNDNHWCINVYIAFYSCRCLRPS